MSFQTVRKNIEGPMQVLPTFFTSDNKLDNNRTKDCIDFMVEGGIKTGNGSILVQGAVAQFYTLTWEERLEHAEACVKAADGRVPLVVGCQEIGTDKVIKLVKHAAAIGADAVQIAPPHYYFANQLSQDDVFGFVSEIADAADIALVVYNNWWSTVGIAPQTLARMADQIDSVVGTKWRGRDLYDNYLGYKLCADKLTMLENDYWFTLTAAHQLGSRGYVTYFGTLWPEYDLEVWRLMESRQYDEAGKKLASLGVPVMELSMHVSGDHSNILSALFEMAGFPAWTPRKPTPAGLPPDARAELKRIVEAAGMQLGTQRSA